MKHISDELVRVNNGL